MWPVKEEITPFISVKISNQGNYQKYLDVMRANVRKNCENINKLADVISCSATDYLFLDVIITKENSFHYRFVFHWAHSHLRLKSVQMDSL